MSTVTDIPRGWVRVRIGDVFDFIGGGTPSKKVANYWSGNINWASVKDVKGEYLEDTEDKISKAGLEDSAANLAYKGDVILITRISPGKTIISKITSAVNQDLKIIKPKFKTSSEFVRYLFKSIKRKCVALSSGTTVLGITLNNLNEILVPLPPLSEQQRIVEKLEELFSDLDKGIESLKTAQQQLKVYRQAVLKWAFEGKLTNENVKDGELPKDWKEEIISEIAFTYSGYAFKSQEFKQKGKFQVLRMGNIRPGFLRYDESPVFVEDVAGNALNKALLKLNDVVITQTGTKGKRDYGFTALITKENLLLNQRIVAIRCNEKCFPKYLLYYSWTDKFRNQFFENETGNVGQGNVGIGGVKDTIICLPDIDAQKSIVSEIESRLSVCDKIEESIVAGLRQSEALRQSILKKAFEGKLVPQDPKDEPASVLLSRIKAEREKLEAVKKIKPKTVKKIKKVKVKL